MCLGRDAGVRISCWGIGERSSGLSCVSMSANSAERFRQALAEHALRQALAAQQRSRRRRPLLQEAQSTSAALGGGGDWVASVDRQAIQSLGRDL